MTNILGHDKVIAEFIAAMHGERMHHAWLLAGPEGLGKASLAVDMARRLLAEAADPGLGGSGLDVPAENPTAHLLAAGSHPDFRYVERLPKDEKLHTKPKTDWPDTLELARGISVDQVRRLNNSFATMPSLSPRRVVIIDAIDDLERSPANALLKTLEEPPKGTIFLLVSHAPGRLLPTIRSRCRMLRFAPLLDSAMASFIAREMPELSMETAENVIAMARGLPGQAVKAAALDLSKIDAALDILSSRGDASNVVRIALGKSLSGKAAQVRYEAFLARVPHYIAGVARTCEGDALENALTAWDGARALAQNAVHASLDPQSVIFALSDYVAALAPVGSAAKA
jgi:DNA polymerase III subunit delta'